MVSRLFYIRWLLLILHFSPLTSTAIYGPDGSLLTEEIAGDAQTILYEISKLVLPELHADFIRQICESD